MSCLNANRTVIYLEKHVFYSISEDPVLSLIQIRLKIFSSKKSEILIFIKEETVLIKNNTWAPYEQAKTIQLNFFLFHEDIRVVIDCAETVSA